MCGIFGFVGSKTVASKIVLSGLKQLEYRGYDSWGVAVVPTSSKKNNTIVVKKKAGKIGNAHVSDLPSGTLAFGHTRWATHGGVTDKNAHPHLDCTGKIAVIHNGIVENYETLKNTLESRGHKIVSDTDTEIIAHLVEEYMKRYPSSARDVSANFPKAVQAAFNELEGLNAIILIHAEAQQMVAARNGSPLVVGFGSGENFLSSDPSALLPHTKQVHYVEDDQMVVVSGQNIHIFNARTGERIRPRKQHLTWTLAETVKGNYPFFMIKEIHEQPGLISEIAADSPNQATLMAEKIGKADRIYAIGSGTSSHAAQAATYMFADVAKRDVNWALASESRYRIDLLSKKSIVIALSQSGETMDLLEPLGAAKAKHIPIVALVNVVGSTLWRMADFTLPIGAGPEKGVASTKAFTTKIAHLILIAYALAGQVSAGQKLLAKAARATADVIKHAKQIASLAKKLKKQEHMFVIGRGMSYPAALETALKIKEISYIHAEGVAAGELKHGPLALVTDGLPCIVIAPKDEHYAEHLASAQELKARGGYIIGISHAPSDVFDEYIHVEDVGIASLIPNVMVGQLLAYYLTIERGFDPDMPRNLAKSVTVK